MYTYQVKQDFGHECNCFRGRKEGRTVVQGSVGEGVVMMTIINYIVGNSSSGPQTTVLTFLKQVHPCLDCMGTWDHV